MLREVSGKAGIEYHLIEMLTADDQTFVALQAADDRAADVQASAVARGDSARRASAAETEETDMKTLTDFVVRTLTSFDGLPVSRLHQFSLKYSGPGSVAGGGFGVSEARLHDVLSRLAEEGVLRVDDDGSYHRAASLL